MIGSSVIFSATASGALASSTAFGVAAFASSVTNVMTIFSSTGASAFFGSSFLNGSLCSNPVAIKVMPNFCPNVSS